MIARAGPARAILAGTILLGCRVENPDHCLHKDANPHAWCKAETEGERPFCSPCEAESNGCVTDEPRERDCPMYVPPDELDGEDGEETDEGPTEGQTEGPTGGPVENENETDDGSTDGASGRTSGDA